MTISYENSFPIGMDRYVRLNEIGFKTAAMSFYLHILRLSLKIIFWYPKMLHMILKFFAFLKFDFYTEKWITKFFRAHSSKFQSYPKEFKSSVDFMSSLSAINSVDVIAFSSLNILFFVYLTRKNNFFFKIVFLFRL